MAKENNSAGAGTKAGRSAASSAPNAVTEEVKRLTGQLGLHRTKAQDAGSRLYHLAAMTKVAAFANEARKALDSIEFHKSLRPQLAALLEQSDYSNHWQDLEDAVPELLDNIGHEIYELATQVIDVGVQVGFVGRDIEEAANV